MLKNKQMEGKSKSPLKPLTPANLPSHTRKLGSIAISENAAHKTLDLAKEPIGTHKYLNGRKR
jgi:hypothetical protein